MIWVYRPSQIDCMLRMYITMFHWSPHVRMKFGFPRQQLEATKNYRKNNRMVHKLVKEMLRNKFPGVGFMDI